MTLRIVSRGSELALWQTHHVRDRLRAAHPRLEVEVRVVRTTGDRILDVPLAKIGDKGLFTKELDQALLAGEADLAVHSLKDVPTRLPEGLLLVAVSAREDARDVLLLPRGMAGTLASLPAGARVGTSSLRRRAQLRLLRPDVDIVDLRGNLNTRLARLDAGDYDAILLAAAGVLRLGWEARIAEYLDPSEWLPAVGQGALGIVARADAPSVAGYVAALHDAATAAAVTAERALLRSLEGGCQVPIAAFATANGRRLSLEALVADLAGRRRIRNAMSGPIEEADRIGQDLAELLIDAGAAELLREVRADVEGAAPQPPAP
jgi:hydroxymethylbilane synthase